MDAAAARALASTGSPADKGPSRVSVHCGPAGPHVSAFPREQFARLVQAAAEFEKVRRTFGVPGVLVVAHPLQAYGLAHGARKQHRVMGGIEGSVGAIGARAIQVDHAHLFGRDAEDFCERLRRPKTF